MIHVQEWLTKTDVTLKHIETHFQTIVDKTSKPNIDKILHEAFEHIERDFIPQGQKLRDTWKEKNKTVFDSIKVHLQKLHFASLSISTVLSLLK